MASMKDSLSFSLEEKASAEEEEEEEKNEVPMLSHNTLPKSRAANDNDTFKTEDNKCTLRSRRGRRRSPPDNEGVSSLDSVRSQVPIQNDDEKVEADSDLDNPMIRLNHYCQIACANILQNLTNTNLINNNVEKKVESVTTTNTAASTAPLPSETDSLILNYHQKASSQIKRSSCIYKSQLAKVAESNLILGLLEVILFSCILLCIAYGFIWLSKVSYLRTTRHSQDAIYPVLRTMRITSLAFLLNYPHAQELYEDACIVNNPFYEMNDVSCWPCESVRHVLDFTGFSNFTSGYYQSGIPFIVKDALANKVFLSDIYRLLDSDPNNLTSVVPLQSNHPNIQTFKDLHKNLEPGTQALWKVNRAQYARLLRTLFLRPYYIPQETEVSVQHFLFIDQQDVQSYPLPLTEFANVFLMQGSGPRLVILVPVRHCQSVCNPIRVLLEPRDVLYYNWLFWRPILSPVKRSLEGHPKDSLSITYMGSFY